MHAARVIKEAIEELEGPIREFLRKIFCLATGTYGRTVTDRYEMAGEEFGVKGRAARDERYKDSLLMHLAMALYERLYIEVGDGQFR